MAGDAPPLEGHAKSAICVTIAPGAIILDGMSVESRRSWRRWLMVERHAVPLPDGSAVTLVAKPAGYPVVESRGRMAVPLSINLLYDVVRYLRYRVGHRGTWVIHVFDGDLSEGGLRDAREIRTLSVPSRRMSRERVEEVSQLLQSGGLAALGDAV